MLEILQTDQVYALFTRRRLWCLYVQKANRGNRIVGRELKRGPNSTYSRYPHRCNSFDVFMISYDRLSIHCRDGFPKCINKARRSCTRLLNVRAKQESDDEVHESCRNVHSFGRFADLQILPQTRVWPYSRSSYTKKEKSPPTGLL